MKKYNMNYKTTEKILNAIQHFCDLSNISISTENKDCKGRSYKSDFITIIKSHKIWFRLVAIVFVSSMILLSSCSASTGEGFAIYLIKEDISPSNMEALSHVNLTDNPIIYSKDIISYDAQSHKIKLTEAAYERITQLVVPTSGKSFLVCVDKSPIYWGAFWVDISSLSFNGVIIPKPLSTEESKVISLELGYPSSSIYTGDDPRANKEVLTALEKSDKLINKP